MIIRTAQDYRLVTCCGCELQLSPEPKQRCKSLVGYAELAYAVLEYGEEEIIYYQASRTDYADGGFTQSTMSSKFRATLGGDEIVSAVLEYTDGDPKTGAMDTSRIMAFDPSAALDDAVAAIDAEIDWENDDFTYGGACNAYLRRRDPVLGFSTLGVVDAVNVIYQMGVPDDYSTEEAPRTYYHTEWEEWQVTQKWLDWAQERDLAEQALADYREALEYYEACEEATPGECGEEPEEPEPFDDEEPTPKPKKLASRSWTWDGDMEDLWSDWIDMERADNTDTDPDDDVMTVLANGKAWHYRDSKFGTKPTAWGMILTEEESP